MPSREMRRQKKRRQERRQTHPVLYSLSLLLFVIVVIAFVGAPLVDDMGGGSRLIFGEYAGEPIEYRPGNFFALQVQNINESLRDSSLSGDIEYQRQLVWRRAFNQTALHVAILHHAEQAGVTVTQDRVDEALTRYPAYMENGEFSETVYANTPNSERAEHRRNVREQLIKQTYVQDVFDSQYTPASEVDFLVDLARSERKFRFVALSMEDYPQAEVAEYGRQNTHLFSRMQLSRITVKTSEEDAEQVLQEAREPGANFVDLATVYSKDSFAEKGGDMGWRYYYDMLPDFEREEDLEAVFDLSEGEISDVIDTAFGWVIYRANSPVEQPDFENEDTLSRVREYMTRFERGRIEDYLVEEAESYRSAVQESTFSEAAQAEGYETHETGFFPINYGNVQFLERVSRSDSHPALGQAPFNQRFFVQAFALEEDEVSEPVILGDHVVVLQLMEEQQAEEEDLEFMRSYLDVFVQRFKEEELQRQILNSEQLEDRFAAVYAEYLAPRPAE
jgi:parvulin-like peptidyl-prolyl isomerase